MKTADPTACRPMPELPHLAKAIQYKCDLEDDEVRTVEDVMRQGLHLEAEVDGESAQMLMRQWLARRNNVLGLPAGQPPTDPEAEAQKKRKEFEAAAAREKKKEDAKAALALKKETPVYKGTAWVKLLQIQIAKAQEAHKKSQSDECGLPHPIAKEFAAIFAKDVHTMQACRTAVQSALEGSNCTLVADSIAHVGTIVETFKRNERSFSASCKAAIPKEAPHPKLE